MNGRKKDLKIRERHITQKITFEKDENENVFVSTREREREREREEWYSLGAPLVGFSDAQNNFFSLQFDSVFLLKGVAGFAYFDG